MILASFLGSKELTGSSEGWFVDRKHETAGMRIPTRAKNLRNGSPEISLFFLFPAKRTHFFSKPSLRTNKALWLFIMERKKKKEVVGSFLSSAGLPRVINLGKFLG